MKFPLRKEILLMTNTGIVFVGEIVYASNESLTIVDLRKRVYDIQDNFISHIDIDISERAFLKRNEIIGYAYLDAISCIKNDPPTKTKKSESKIINIVTHRRQNDGN